MDPLLIRPIFCLLMIISPTMSSNLYSWSDIYDENDDSVHIKDSMKCPEILQNTDEIALMQIPISFRKYLKISNSDTEEQQSASSSMKLHGRFFYGGVPRRTQGRMTHANQQQEIQCEYMVAWVRAYFKNPCRCPSVEAIKEENIPEWIRVFITSQKGHVGSVNLSPCDLQQWIRVFVESRQRDIHFRDLALDLNGRRVATQGSPRELTLRRGGAYAHKPHNFNNGRESGFYTAPKSRYPTDSGAGRNLKKQKRIGSRYTPPTEELAKSANQIQRGPLTLPERHEIPGSYSPPKKIIRKFYISNPPPSIKKTDTVTTESLKTTDDPEPVPIIHKEPIVENTMIPRKVIQQETTDCVGNVECGSEKVGTEDTVIKTTIEETTYYAEEPEPKVLEQETVDSDVLLKGMESNVPISEIEIESGMEGTEEPVIKTTIEETTYYEEEPESKVLEQETVDRDVLLKGMESNVPISEIEIDSGMEGTEKPVIETIIEETTYYEEEPVPQVQEPETIDSDVMFKSMESNVPISETEIDSEKGVIEETIITTIIEETIYHEPEPDEVDTTIKYEIIEEIPKGYVEEHKHSDGEGLVLTKENHDFITSGDRYVPGGDGKWTLLENGKTLEFNKSSGLLDGKSTKKENALTNTKQTSTVGGGDISTVKVDNGIPVSTIVSETTANGNKKKKRKSKWVFVSQEDGLSKKKNDVASRVNQNTEVTPNVGTGKDANRALWTNRAPIIEDSNFKDDVGKIPLSDGRITDTAEQFINGDGSKQNSVWNYRKDDGTESSAGKLIDNHGSTMNSVSKFNDDVGSSMNSGSKFNNGAGSIMHSVTKFNDDVGSTGSSSSVREFRDVDKTTGNSVNYFGDSYKSSEYSGRQEDKGVSRIPTENIINSGIELLHEDRGAV